MVNEQVDKAGEVMRGANYSSGGHEHAWDMLAGPEEAGTEAVVEEGPGEAAGRKGAGGARQCSSCAAQLPASSTRAHVLHRTKISPFSSSTPSGSPISSTLVTEVLSVSLIVACRSNQVHNSLGQSGAVPFV